MPRENARYGTRTGTSLRYLLKRTVRRYFVVLRSYFAKPDPSKTAATTSMALHNPFEGCPEGFHVSGLALVIVLGAKMGEPILKTQKYVAMACTAVCGTRNLN